MILQYNDIYEIELELTGQCNLKCPLCISQHPDFQHLKQINVRPLNEIIAQLELFKNLKLVLLAGMFTEPTLYPDIFDLIKYIKSRNIQLDLYTNGTPHTDEWWKELGSYLQINDRVIFTICGSTQELHEKYRRGSNLQYIINHAAALRTNNLKNDWIQHILFEYNQEDFKSENMKNIINQFSNKQLINSSAYAERFKFDTEHDICMVKNLSKKYKTLMSNALIRRQSHKQFKIDCKSLELHGITIDNFGKIFPCYIYRMYVNNSFNLDYTDILNYKYECCFECEHFTNTMLEMNNLERMM